MGASSLQLPRYGPEPKGCPRPLSTKYIDKNLADTVCRSAAAMQQWALLAALLLATCVDCETGVAVVQAGIPAGCRGLTWPGAAVAQQKLIPKRRSTVSTIAGKPGRTNSSIDGVRAGARFRVAEPVVGKMLLTRVRGNPQLTLMDSTGKLRQVDVETGRTATIADYGPWLAENDQNTEGCEFLERDFTWSAVEVVGGRGAERGVRTVTVAVVQKGSVDKEGLGKGDLETAVYMLVHKIPVNQLHSLEPYTELPTSMKLAMPISTTPQFFLSSMTTFTDGEAQVWAAVAVVSTFASPQMTKEASCGHGPKTGYQVTSGSKSDAILPKWTPLVISPPASFQKDNDLFPYFCSQDVCRSSLEFSSKRICQESISFTTGLYDRWKFPGTETWVQTAESHATVTGAASNLLLFRVPSPRCIRETLPPPAEQVRRSQLLGEAAWPPGFNIRGHSGIMGSFYLGYLGSNYCRSGYYTIQNSVECETASRSFGLTEVRYQGAQEYQDRPGGCYWRQLHGRFNYFYFNPNFAGKGMSDAQKICGLTYVKPTPKPTPRPTQAPTTAHPTGSPTAPTPAPTNAPSTAPTLAPTDAPTDIPCHDFSECLQPPPQHGVHCVYLLKRANLTMPRICCCRLPCQVPHMQTWLWLPRQLPQQRRPAPEQRWVLRAHLQYV